MMDPPVTVRTDTNHVLGVIRAPVRTAMQVVNLQNGSPPESMKEASRSQPWHVPFAVLSANRFTTFDRVYDCLELDVDSPACVDPA